jgi:hypothetical protein
MSGSRRGLLETDEAEKWLVQLSSSSSAIIGDGTKGYPGYSFRVKRPVGPYQYWWKKLRSVSSDRCLTTSSGIRASMIV